MRGAARKAIEAGLSPTLELHAGGPAGAEELFGGLPPAVSVDVIFEGSATEEGMREVCGLMAGHPSASVKNDTLKKAGMTYWGAQVSEYSLALFDCVFDFENDCAPVGRERRPVRLSECRSVADYWYSPVFKRARESALRRLGGRK